MKHLLTLTALLLTFSGLAQQMPYNPDANGDDFVGVDDVLGVLGVYDTALMQPDLQCDYEGTDLESLIVGIITGSHILDSVYVEYSIHDTLVYFTPGCPDAIVEPIFLERSYVISDWLPYGSDGIQGTVPHFGHSRKFGVSYLEQSNEFAAWLTDYEIGAVCPSYDAHSYWMTENLSAYFQLPFPPTWSLDENGFHLQFHPTSWAYNCEHLRIIPFWHEAE